MKTYYRAPKEPSLRELARIRRQEKKDRDDALVAEFLADPTIRFTDLRRKYGVRAESVLRKRKIKWEPRWHRK